MSMQVQITGVDLVVAKLEALARRTAQQYQAFGEIADVMTQEARQRVPRRSGRLSASLRASHGRRVAETTAGGGGLRYAPVIEYGWRGHGISPDPYLVPAADASEDDAVRILTSDLNTQIRVLGL